MAYMLLTGATGLLGGYLLRDALREDLPIAVIVRRTAAFSARRRIDAVLAPFEQERALPRPVVLEGDLSKAGLGLNSADHAWLRDNCRSVLHSAASISFYREEKSGEPYRTNVDGTRHLLSLCRDAGIDEFHHVSTAYVCGRRSGRILESELEVGQEHGNDYELSKVASEKLVQAAGFRQPPTVYRPSIIVGDSQTGYTTTFHGYYTPLQIAWWLAKAGMLNSGVNEWFLGQLGLMGQERKNIVPVDWVSRVILHLVRQPTAHGRTFHLTSDEPPTANELALAIGDALQDRLAKTSGGPSASQALPDLIQADDFRKHMDVYRAYFRDHPDFDTSNLHTFASDIPCPQIDRQLLARTGKYALDSNFGWPRTQAPAAPLDVHALCTRAGDDRVPAVEDAQNSLFVLEVTGPGGGAWSFNVPTSGSTFLAQRGRALNAAATIRMRSDTLADIVAGELSIEVALRTALIFIAAPANQQEVAVAGLRQLVSSNSDLTNISPRAATANGHSRKSQAIRVPANLGETT